MGATKTNITAKLSISHLMLEVKRMNGVQYVGDDRQAVVLVPLGEKFQVEPLVELLLAGREQLVLLSGALDDALVL